MFFLSMLLPMLLFVFAVGWIMLGPSANGWRFGRWIAWGIVGSSSVFVGMLVHWMRIPRLAYENDELLVFLGTARPFRVPIDLVEVFFLGQGSAVIGGKNENDTQTANIVVRLSESEEQWKHRDVKPALGHWCDGYITIRGTWCEPITADLLKELNRRLVESHQEIRAKKKGSGSRDEVAGQRS